MAKKKPTLNLSTKNITFSEKERHFKVISFNQERMTLDCIVTVDDKKERVELPFAHLPKEVKKLIRPL
jgi:5-formyltetrahydrofolate cyclo-ligase